MAVFAVRHAVGALARDDLFAVCADGATFVFNHVTGWEEREPVPGTERSFTWNT